METEFGERNCHHFDDTEENKFIYTDLHKEYTAAVESYLVDALTRRVPGFKMSDFLKMLAYAALRGKAWPQREGCGGCRAMPSLLRQGVRVPRRRNNPI